MSTVNMEAYMTELTYMEQLAKLRLARIQELEEQIKSRRAMAQGYIREADESVAFKGYYRVLGHRLEAEADDLQRRLDALLGRSHDES